MRYILRQYSKNEKTVNGISMEVFRKVEEMQELTLDILNTILIEMCIRDRSGCFF